MVDDVASVIHSALAPGWYGYYKFSVEEELFQDELRREGRVSGRVRVQTARHVTHHSLNTLVSS